MGVLFAAYVIVRLAIGWEFRLRPPAEKTRWDSKEAMQPIDASKLCGRVEQLRQEGHAAAAEKSASFKKTLLVEEKKQEIGKMAFFQKPPPPEPVEHEGGMGLMLI